MTHPVHPCPECPFSRACIPVEHLGGSKPEVYLGQVNGPFWLPCHACYDPTKPAEDQDYKEVGQCAGAATFRTHVGVALASPANRLLPEDHDRVFSSHAEFLAHHTGHPLEVCENYLSMFPVDAMTLIQLQCRGSKLHLIPRQ